MGEFLDNNSLWVDEQQRHSSLNSLERTQQFQRQPTRTGNNNEIINFSSSEHFPTSADHFGEFTGHQHHNVPPSFCEQNFYSNNRLRQKVPQNPVFKQQPSQGPQQHRRPQLTSDELNLYRSTAPAQISSLNSSISQNHHRYDSQQFFDTTATATIPNNQFYSQRKGHTEVSRNNACANYYDDDDDEYNPNFLAHSQWQHQSIHHQRKRIQILENNWPGVQYQGKARRSKGVAFRNSVLLLSLKHNSCFKSKTRSGPT